MKMIKRGVFKHNKSIKAKIDRDTELMISNIMALLVEQNRVIKRIESISRFKLKRIIFSRRITSSVFNYKYIH
jgi:hypothetical protein